MEKALEALHVAASAIRTVDGVADVSADNDNDSGEIFFRVGEQEWRLKLEEVVEV